MRIITVLIFLMFLTLNISAQELLVGGNMENAAAWNFSHLDSQDTTKYEFNYTSEGPQYGNGGCLHAWASVTQSTNVIFWQPVMLTGGDEYEVSGAFADIGGTITNFWCEILYDTVAPPVTGDVGGTTIVGFNTWNGTPQGIDGTFQDNSVKGIGPVFTAPGEIGVPDTVYFMLNIGVWAGGASYSFNVVVDELSLIPAGGSAVDHNQVSIPNQFALFQNYPNPFNPQTTITYSLPQGSAVTLKIYDSLGREITTLLNQEPKAAGRYDISFNAGNIPSGIYFYKLTTAYGSFVKKMTLLK
jgi:hypothetical protein